MKRLTYKERILSMLDKAVEDYYLFANRDDIDKLCVLKEINCRQSTVFNLADYLYHHNFITWEECCEYWCKVNFVDELNKCCKFECGANINGVCKYYIEKFEGGTK